MAAGATYTGEWEDVAQYDSLVIAYKTSANGTMQVDFSTDANNADSTLTRYYRTNQIEAPHRFTITRKYARVKFTNTHTANQSYFRLQTMYGSKTPLNVPLDAVVAQDYDATAVRPTNYNYEAALGLRQGATTWNKWGYNTQVNTGSSSTIWSVGGRITPMTVANTININSTHAGDTSAGLGARSVVVYGINAKRESITELVALNGTANVTTVNRYLGINRIATYLCGANGVNIGNITARNRTDGTIQGRVPATQGVTQQNIFFTQNNHVGLADWFMFNVNKLSGSSPVVTIRGIVTPFLSNAKYEVFRINIDTAVENTITLSPNQPFIFTENTMFELIADTTQNNTVVTARFSLIEVKNVDA